MTNSELIAKSRKSRAIMTRIFSGNNFYMKLDDVSDMLDMSKTAVHVSLSSGIKMVSTVDIKNQIGTEKFRALECIIVSYGILPENVRMISSSI